MASTTTAPLIGQAEFSKPLPAGPRLRLSVMMFLELFIWGAWLPLIFGYLPSLGFTPLQQSWILNCFALASFVGMFFSNQFADRNFSAEKFLAVSHLIGGVAVLALAFIHPAQAGGPAPFWPFFALMLVHCLFYVPTLSITNSIAFANLKDPQKDYGMVRLWGTIGWIAASWPFVFILVEWSLVPKFGSVPFTTWLGKALGTPKTGSSMLEATRFTFVAAGIASLLLAAFSLVLPHTPPKPATGNREQFAWLEAMKLLKVPFVLVLFVITFFDAAVHQCYFIWTNSFYQSVGIPGNWVMPAMSIGQVAEISTMALLGMVLKRLGWRKTMFIGIMGHTIRFGLFALVPVPWVVVAVNAMHGICYAFFFATVYIFVDEFFPKDARTSAQGLFNFLIFGFGPFVANFVWPFLGAQCIEPVKIDMLASNVAVVSIEHRMPTIKGLAAPNSSVSVVYKDSQRDSQTSKIAADDKGTWSDTTQFVSRDASGVYSVTATAMNSSTPATITGVEEHNFKKIFLAPSATGLVAALMLLLFFHPPKKKAPDAEMAQD